MAEQRSRQQSTTDRNRLHGGIAAVLILGGTIFVGGAVAERGCPGIVAYPIGAMVGFGAAVLSVGILDPSSGRQMLWLVPSLICHAWRRSEARDFAAAARISGAGRITRSGRFVIWTDAADPIEAELERILSATEVMFETHLDLQALRPRGLRVLVFERETGFLTYTRAFYRNADTVAGYHIGFLQPRIVICSEVAEDRHGVFSVAAHEMAHHWQHQCLGGRRPPWLEEGLATLIQNRVQPALHPPGAPLRYIRAETARGTLQSGSDLLAVSYQDLHACVANQNNTMEFLAIVRIYVQSAVLCRFLLERDPDRFRAFLRLGRRIRVPRRCARTFEQFFESKPDDVMDACLSHLREQPLAPFTAPPDDVKERIENRLVPMATAVDADTPQRCRLRAIRTLGLLGYPWRADILVGCLTDSDEFVRANAAISLANLSGESRGADAAVWRDWLDSLSADVVAPAARE